jgi:hypothetical protein
MKVRGLLFFISALEIFFMGPRTIFYIFIDLFPVRVFGLPLITFSFLVTSTGYLLTELFASRQLLKKIKFFRIVLWIWTLIVIISSAFNPFRDVIFESQGMIIFMMNIIIFSSASCHLGENYKRLIMGILISISFTIMWVVYKLITDPSSLPSGYSAFGRYEGLFTSSSIVGLAAISSYYVVINEKNKLLGLIGLLTALIGLFLSGTRTVMISSLISLIIILYYYSKINKKSLSLFKSSLIGLLIFYSFTYLVNFYPPLKDSFEYTLIRISNLGSVNDGSTRLAEISKELDLFSESPIFGYGYGILNEYKIPGFGRPLFGHNFITSLLARSGVLGFIIILLYWKGIFKKISFRNNSFSNQAVVIARAAFIGAISLTIVSNFSGFQTFGIYGSLIGIAVGARFKANEI